ncbi:MAG: alpha-ketoglutarate-dependent dioxygenase AlkB family protein [Granulosicoccaceae bacterium]
MQAIHHPSHQCITRLPLSTDSWLSYLPQWLDSSTASELQHTLMQSLNWQAGQIKLFGRQVAIPRLHAWYGDPLASYGWSGQRATPLPWTPELAQLRDKLKAHCDSSFNGVLANLYRDGQDCMHWHADNEPELGSRPTIAAISLGAERRFSLRHKHRAHPTHRLQLGHGSLLLMGGECQRHWQHALPRSMRVPGARISLTFRFIHPR